MCETARLADRSFEKQSAPARPEKQTLTLEREIVEALKRSTVFCAIEGLGTLIVRNVRRRKIGPTMKVQVLVTEGWHTPTEVWTCV
jgi:hypothetical protein